MRRPAGPRCPVPPSPTGIRPTPTRPTRTRPTPPAPGRHPPGRRRRDPAVRAPHRWSGPEPGGTRSRRRRPRADDGRRAHAHPGGRLGPPRLPPRGRAPRGTAGLAADRSRLGPTRVGAAPARRCPPGPGAPPPDPPHRPRRPARGRRDRRDRRRPARVPRRPAIRTLRRARPRGRRARGHRRRQPRLAPPDHRHRPAPIASASVPGSPSSAPRPSTGDPSRIPVDVTDENGAYEVGQPR